MASPTNVAAHEKGMLQVRQSGQQDLAQAAAKFDYSGLVAELRDNIRVKKITATAEYRIEQLLALRKGIDEYSDKIIAAVAADHGRHPTEGFLGEISSSVGEIDICLENLKSWMEPLQVPTPMMLQPSSSMVVYQPKGVVLVVAPWNFPIYLAFSGVIAAVCAGNACVVKPSEITPNCSKVVEEILTKYMDPRIIRVIQGAVAETTALLRERWDHILYTGNGAVGRIVQTAAAKHLTPVTLELGGKSPAYVDKSANIGIAANRILGPKLINNGQICVATDYVLVHENVAKELVAAFKDRIKAWLGENQQKSPNFSRIVNVHHFDRLKRLLSENHGGEVVAGGLATADRADRFIPPTLVLNPSPKSSLMQEEIFGPILPIISVHDEQEAINFINARESPLALYVFADDATISSKLIDNTLAGGSVINDTVFHVLNPYLPFGGVGTSGLGSYHGKWGFEELSHKRAVMNRATWLDPSNRYMPYNENDVALLKKIVIGPLIPPAVKNALLVGGVAATGMIMLRSFL